MDKIAVNQKEFEIIKLLGKGKGGYSYLCKDGQKQVVVKKIHHEPCSYYTFGNKIESECNDYQRLSNIGVLMPKMLDVDKAKETILKEYIDGPTVYDLVKQDCLPEFAVPFIKEICQKLYAANTNIDYFPTNFVVQENQLYYVDYECNDYMQEWNFENWGIKYWSKTPEFLQYVKDHEQCNIFNLKVVATTAFKSLNKRSFHFFSSKFVT